MKASHPDSSLTPAQVLIRPQDNRFSDSHRIWQGIPSIEKTRPGGQLYAVFYSGMKTEGSGNFTVVIRSRDDGQTWFSPEMIIEHPDPEVRVFDPCIWRDPLDRLWITWTQSRSFFDERAGVWAIVSASPEADVPKWTEPGRIANGLMMNKPTVLRDGTWLFPCAIWACREASEPVSPELVRERYSNVYASADQGRTFCRRGGADVPNRSFDEHMVVELRDGRLWMLVRTYYGIGQSFSEDDGYTWSPGEDSGLGGPSSRFFIRRLHSGRLLLVNHFQFVQRNNLTASLSEDDGKTWIGRLLLDERDGVSYPDGTEDEQGRITVIYDRQRYKDREILLASLTEQDILDGYLTSSGAVTRRVINRASGKTD